MAGHRGQLAYDPHHDRCKRLPDVPKDLVRGSSAMWLRGHTVYLPGGGDNPGGAPIDVNDACPTRH
ncbi:hypothetical protein ABZS88_45350 [Streptomyces sp. NPDC005480]|uniref:hypothetical protein n=1 Tax=Streptomyces sp. NPDC005480 TaxID=3154880 RepID=UPI0033AB4266